MFNYKLKAFICHFLASLVLVITSAVIVFCIWYPAPLYKATGVNQIFLILIGVSLLVWPLLTFVVSKPDKPSLKFDVLVIVILQLSVFMFGLYHIYDGRPVWIVYNVDRFDLVRNNEIDTRNITEAQSEYKVTSNIGVKYVAAVIPKDNLEISNQILFDEVGSGIAPSQRPELYQPLRDVNDIIVTRSKPIDELYDYNTKAQVDEVLSQYPIADGYLPLKGNTVHMVVLIDKKKNEKVVDIVDLRPW